LLATVAGLAVRRRWGLAGWVGLIWLALSAAGNGQVARLLTEPLERPYFGVDPLGQGEFDAVVLLGGGAGLDRNDRAKVGDAGDRVVVAARLYHAGRTPLLVCTGGDLRGAPNLPTVAETSAAVLVDLGVPREDILLGPGLNTKTETAAIRRLKDEHGWERVGVVTSAWHMPRVERLARGAGLTFVPLPADFRSGAEGDLPFWERFRRFSFIPKSGTLDRTHAMLKENLARLAGR
ncbi:MAG TPA: YdcF family protein, partial [Planctomycetaceae bacterium]